MPRKNEKKGSRNNRGGGRHPMDYRSPRPRPKVDFGIEAIDYRNVNLLRQYVTDEGRILPRKYTGLPAPYQRRLNRAIKQARQMLLMR